MSDLVQFLAQAGYHRIALTQNGVGHFETDGSLAGQPISVLIDTGASNTVIDLALAHRLGLEFSKLDRLGGGAGGTNLELYVVPNAALKVGDITARFAMLVAMDLTHVNESLAQRGSRPVEAILGIDVFEAQSAIIDYGSRSLFLRE
jgi:clan AA aspartic protease (TIGR02281 family)